MTDRGNKKDESLLATVLVTGDIGKIAVAKSLLEAADIAYFAKGEQLQNLFGIGTIGGRNPICGFVELQVAAKDYDKSMEILNGSFGEEVGEPEDGEEER